MVYNLGWIIGIFCLLSWPATNKDIHEFYVSMAEVKYDLDHRFKLQIRYFKDDLELALSSKNGTEFLNEGFNHHQQMVDSYVRNHVKIEVKGQEIPLVYQTFISEGSPPTETVLVKLESRDTYRNYASATISHWALFEVFEDQINMVHFKTDEGKRKSQNLDASGYSFTVSLNPD